MKASIDKAGRLVIPKQVRDAVGLAPGSTVEVSIDGAGIRVESITSTGFEERDGFLVIPAAGRPITARTFGSFALPTRRSVVLVDTSVAVAAMLGDHESRPAVVEALTGTRPGLAGHAWFETYSVLTRLPAPQRRPAQEISSALHRNFPETRWISQAASSELAARCASLGIAGGAVYDALVAAVAVAEDLLLLTRDLRALGTYQAIGARVKPIT